VQDGKVRGVVAPFQPDSGYPKKTDEFLQLDSGPFAGEVLVKRITRISVYEKPLVASIPLIV